MLKILDQVGGVEHRRQRRPDAQGLAGSQSAGLGLILGLLGALWSASGYVGAFGRALNRIYERGEAARSGSCVPAMLLLTAVLVVLVAVALAGLVVSGPVTEAVGDAVGLGSTAQLVFRSSSGR